MFPCIQYHHNMCTIAIEYGLVLTVIYFQKNTMLELLNDS